VNAVHIGDHNRDLTLRMATVLAREARERGFEGLSLEMGGVTVTIHAKQQQPELPFTPSEQTPAQ
jgi:hypothetical protein